METLKTHPVIAYFVLPYVLTWWMFPLLQSSPMLGLFGLFGPALAAITMAAVVNGKPGVKSLLKRVVRWRVGARWYVVALGGPAVLHSRPPGWPSCSARRRRSRSAHCRSSTS
jgi:uncharacterized protein